MQSTLFFKLEDVHACNLNIKYLAKSKRYSLNYKILEKQYSKVSDYKAYTIQFYPIF